MRNVGTSWQMTCRVIIRLELGKTAWLTYLINYLSALLIAQLITHESTEYTRTREHLVPRPRDPESSDKRSEADLQFVDARAVTD